MRADEEHPYKSVYMTIKNQTDTVSFRAIVEKSPAIGNKSGEHDYFPYACRQSSAPIRVANEGNMSLYLAPSDEGAVSSVSEAIRETEG